MNDKSSNQETHQCILVYCDNEAIVSNSSKAELTLKKKYLPICSNKTRECYAKDVMRIGYEPTETNLADVYTKILTEKNKGQKIRHIVY